MDTRAEASAGPRCKTIRLLLVSFGPPQKRCFCGPNFSAIIGAEEGQEGGEAFHLALQS